MSRQLDSYFNNTSANSNNTLMYAVIIAIIFFVFILPKLEKKHVEEELVVKENMESLKNSRTIRKLDTNKCSTDCCNHTQWPVPHMPNKKPSKYIGSNLMCNGNGGGCLCVTKEDKDFLYKRGKNFLPCTK
jgi:hypothetical protein